MAGRIFHSNKADSPDSRLLASIRDSASAIGYRLLVNSLEPASSHPPQKPLKPLADSTPNLTPHAVDHREIPASTHQPGGDIPRPWSREFRSPPRNEFPVKESSGEPLIGQKPSPLPLPSQSGCGGS